MSTFRSRAALRWRGAAALAAAALALVGTGVPARAQSLVAADEVGSWDLSFEKGNRRCRLALRSDTVAVGHQLVAPAGCRHAFPSLGAVAGWDSTPGDHIVFRTAGGAEIMDFGPTGGPTLSARVGEAGDSYVLTPVDASVQDALIQASAAPAAAAMPAAAPARGGSGAGVLVGSVPVQPAAAPTFAPVTAAEVAGHYAVLRQDRDTGCMVTLEADNAKARLAPACRDQGIVIFDPAGWQLSRGQIVLTAKRGHRAELTRKGERTWATTPAKGPALVLKRL